MRLSVLFNASATKLFIFDFKLLVKLLVKSSEKLNFVADTVTKEVAKIAKMLNPIIIQAV